MGSNGNGERSPKGTNVLLTGENLVLQSWKSKPGSLVRLGETIAVACTKEALVSGATPSAASPDPASSSMSHKRPNRRRRAVPSTAALAASSAGTSSTAYSSSNALNPIASIQQRLADKLSSDKGGSSKEAAEKEALSPEASDAAASSKKDESNVPILAPATGILRIFSKSTEASSPSSLVIGCIEECMHPAFLEGLCVVCGESIVHRDGEEEDEDDEHHHVRSPNVPVPMFDPTTTASNNNSSKSNKTSQVTVSGGVTMTVSAAESKQMAQQENERLLHQAKLSLVLDLDHTLVHATADPRAGQFYEKDDVRTLRLPTMEGMHQTAAPSGAPMFMQHHVKLRPHINTFLQSVTKDYELTVYTAGTRQYAEEITIVLCRHLVGSTRDIDDLERLRYQVHMAQIEFQRIQSLQQQQQTPPSPPPPNGDTITTKKRKLEGSSSATAVDVDADNNEDEEPGKKRKKVSFGVPQDEKNQDDDAMEDSKPAATSTRTVAPSTMKSDHMTKDKLEALQKELADAEELEKSAWECRQKVFGSRVVSRTDVGDLGRDVKSLRRIFPCGGTMAAVVDDREDVWANAVDNSHDTTKGEPPDNLLLVRPYHWKPFIGFADVNNSAGEDLSGGQQGNEPQDPDTETDVQLIWTSRILKGLHRRYYRQDMNNRKSVPEVLAQMRSQVLKDSRLVLSGLVPLHKKSIGANQARPPIVRYAHTLGAKVRYYSEYGWDMMVNYSSLIFSFS
jgi:hypothetical protein